MKIKNTIEEFICEEIRKRARERNIVVIYDKTPSGRFRELVRRLGDMASPAIMADEDPVDARKTMGDAVRCAREVFLYVPYGAPQTAAQKCEDPWSVYAVIGSAFPETPADEYEALACRCFSEKIEDIHRCFAQSNGDPDFQTVNQIGNGRSKWPKLAAASGEESCKEMLIWILARATAAEIEKLGCETAEFAEEVLDLMLPSNADPQEVQRRFWQQALSTDYLAGFGENVPEVFAEMPVAAAENQKTVMEALDTIRKHADYETVYVTRADDVENRLRLAEYSIPRPLATYDTFRFEARRRLMAAVAAVTGLDAKKAQVFLPMKSCVWANEAEAAIEWSVVRDAVDCLEAVQAARVDNCKGAAGSLAQIIAGYVRTGAAADTAMRGLEKKLLTVSCETFGAMRRALIANYRNYCVTAQKCFVDTVVREGWPAAGVRDNACVFDELIAPKLVKSQAVAVIVLDGLRYELSSDLMARLRVRHPQRSVACARFPTVTSVGKGTLLPGGKALELVRNKEGQLVSSLEGVEIPGHKERMSLLNSVYGERFQEMLLSDYLSGKKRLLAKTALLVLRGDDIDGLLEQNSPAALQSVETTFVDVEKALRKLQENRLVKFTSAIIMTDHGFFYNYEPQASDVCAKPEGCWDNFHSRMLLGESVASESSNVIVPASTLGIRAPVKEVAFPRGLCAYESNQYYFHGGVSLQEALVPVISVNFATEDANISSTVATGKILLRPRKTRFTSLVVRVIARDAVRNAGVSEDGVPRRIEILAHLAGDRNRTSVGSLLDNSQGIVTLDGDEDVEFRIKLESAPFETGPAKVVVRALDPESHIQLGETSFEVEVMS